MAIFCDYIYCTEISHFILTLELTYVYYFTNVNVRIQRNVCACKKCP